LVPGVHEHHQQGAEVQGAGAGQDGAAEVGQHVRQGEEKAGGAQEGGRPIAEGAH